MGDEQALTVQKHDVVDITSYAMTADAVLRQVELIHNVMKKVMKDGEHYGTIPGCGPKPTLLKPGAEKLSVTFRLAPTYKITKTDLPGGHREYELVCTLTHVPSGLVFSQGVGSCSTMESKYRFRNAAKKCPECGKEAIIKGKAEFGGGWLCFRKKGGCGAKWNDGEAIIEDQPDGKVEHDNPADYHNTVLKISKKRSHTDAVLTATAASDIFTQDVEDMKQNGESFGQEPKTGKTHEGKGATGTQDTIDGLLRKKLAKNNISEEQFCQCAKVGTIEDFSAEQVTVMLRLWPQTVAKFYTWQAQIDPERQAEGVKEVAGDEEEATLDPDNDENPKQSYFKREFDGLRSTFEGKLNNHVNSGKIDEATPEDLEAIVNKWLHDSTTKDKPCPVVLAEYKETDPLKIPMVCPDNSPNHDDVTTLAYCQKACNWPEKTTQCKPFIDAGEDVAF